MAAVPPADALIDTAYASIRGIRVNPTGSLVSTRVAPVNAPEAAQVRRTAIVAVNGRRVVTPQMARVSYLPDDEKLQIASGLFGQRATHGMADYLAAHSVFCTILQLGGAAIPAAGIVLANVTAVRAATDMAYIPGNMKATHDALANAETMSMLVGLQVGDYDDAGVFRNRAGAVEEAGVFVTLAWGATNADRVILGDTVDAGTASPADLGTVLNSVAIQDQLSDFVSAAYALNFSLLDYGCLRTPEMRWADDDCQIDHPVTRYTANLCAYTLSMTAALNLAAVSAEPRLAWTRAYALSMGLLPNDASCHQVEHVMTPYLPENAELKAVMDAHPEGEDGQSYIRGCHSLLASFGLLHLANDHTHKANDEHLLRKATVIVEATRTTLLEGEAKRLSEPTLLKATIRTTPHPFGLSAPWGAFKDGRIHRLLAEPLQCRDTTVPPPVAKIGLVVGIMTKVYALPIGHLFRNAFGEAVKEVEDLRDIIVAHATEYSSLSRHYGNGPTRSITAAQANTASSFMPIVAAYAWVFEVNADNSPIGANLSQSVINCRRDNGGIVAMYTTAFENYRDKGTDIEKLIASAATAAKNVATTTLVAT